jgi:hypothetical protein
MAASLILISNEPMEIHDSQGLIDLLTGTGCFAGMGTDPPADPGKGMVLLEKLQGFPVFPGIDQGDVALDADMGRTGGPARGRSPFGNGIAARNGLGVLFESSPPLGKSFIVLVGNFYGADLGAFPTTGAFGKIDESGLLPETGLEMTRISV